MGDGFHTRVLESMSSGIVGIDARGRVAAWNRGAQRILGCPEGLPESALGRDCREVLAAQPGVARLLLETLERQSPLSRAELVLAGSAGRAGTIGFTLCPVRDADGAPCGAAMIFRDLAPIERRDEQERLRERLAALGQMAAGMAHEIRNPLAGMEVLAGLLRRRLSDRPEEQALLGELLGELRAVARTLAASLEFVRPAVPARASVDPVALLEEALAQALALVPFAGAVERDYAAAGLELLADAEQLRTALVNLLQNALEAMAELPPPAGRLRLALRRREAEREEGGLAAPAELEIRIRDDGPGVPAELREKVFYPFFTTKRKGSGVGLATAQKIVAAHGGHLELESGGGTGPGASFRIRLPAAGGVAA
jgi:nitrogen-specific signal transduction histidine kinase